MPFEPEQPFPKSKGDSIRSQDWNDAVEEVKRLEQDKVDRAGDRIEADLTVEGDLYLGGNVKDPRQRPNALHQEPRSGLDVQDDDDLQFERNVTVTKDLTVEGTIHGTLANDAVGESQLHPDARQKLVTGGDEHAHADGDGGPVRHGDLELDGGRNPHETRHSDLQLDGGRNPHETRHSDLQLDGGRNPHGTTAEDVGAVGLSGANLDERLRLEHEDGSRANLFGRAGFGRQTTLHLAAEDGRAGLWVDADSDSDNATFIVVGDSMFLGDMIVHGEKSGCVTDTFINRSGTTLRPGDVVRLTEAGVMRFQGLRNSLPVAEVALAEQDGDRRVIGVVAGCAPAVDESSAAPSSRDRTSAVDGADVSVVTLGAFANCKVDASYGPIGVGDLLTTSATAGHARTANDPRLGTVIGKALEPIEEGTGYIAVFVTIQ